MLLASSCDDFLNVNENPNAATSADVQLVLPQAITATANIASQYNNYGAHFGGYMANAGGFSGFGTLFTYNLTPSDYNGLWVNTYQDPLRDLRYVIDETEGNGQMAYFNAAAKIMTAFNYQKLVDTFGNIPYSEALRGQEGLVAPAYDDAATIYQSLITMLDEAVAGIIAGEASTTVFPLRLTKASDPLFGSLAEATAERAIEDQMMDWKRFANSLKLKMLVRINAPVADFNDPDFASIGFLTDDAIVDPGYELNRPNPAWNTWGRTTAGALSNSSRVPTTYAFTFYSGTSAFPAAKITDPGRGEVIFVNFGGNNGSGAVTATPNNQLGNEVLNPTIIAGSVTWAGSQNGLTGLGVLKGPAQGQPLMLLAESKFVQAEAQLFGKLAGTYTTTYYEGITASFRYLYKDQAEAVAQDVTPLVATYLTNNDNNRLVEIEAAADNEQRLEAIITQKYIANNMIVSDESYNEFRRTGYPVTAKGGGPRNDIASNKSTLTDRPDNLPTRVMYPSSEASYNARNYVNIDYRSASATKIFWDVD